VTFILARDFSCGFILGLLFRHLSSHPKRMVILQALRLAGFFFAGKAGQINAVSAGVWRQ
jgi:hypothetical protein